MRSSTHMSSSFLTTHVFKSAASSSLTSMPAVRAGAPQRGDSALFDAVSFSSSSCRRGLTTGFGEVGDYLSFARGVDARRRRRCFRFRTKNEKAARLARVDWDYLLGVVTPAPNIK